MWDIQLHREVEAWFLDLRRSDPVTADQVAEALDILAMTGPRLGRPREAIFLVGGDKSGRWKAWYKSAITLADERYAEHLAALQEEEHS